MESTEKSSEERPFYVGDFWAKNSLGFPSCKDCQCWVKNPDDIFGECTRVHRRDAPPFRAQKLITLPEFGCKAFEPSQNKNHG